MPNILRHAHTWQSGVSNNNRHSPLSDHRTLRIQRWRRRWYLYLLSAQRRPVGEKEGHGHPYIQPRVLRHHPLYPYPHALNHSQQKRAPYSRISRRFEPSPYSQRAAGEEPCSNYDAVSFGALDIRCSYFLGPPPCGEGESTYSHSKDPPSSESP